MREVVIFLHLHKTGGTTLKRILENNYSKNEILYLSKLSKKDLNKLSKDFNYKCIMGHVGYGVHRYLPEGTPYKYIVLLREPIKRIISFYRFYKERPLHHFYKKLLNMDLVDFVNIDSSALYNKLNNGQVRQLCGDEDVLLDWDFKKDITKIDYDLALKNLLDKNTFVGLTEEFDKFLILLRENLGLKKIYYFRRNTAKSKKEKIDYDKDNILNSVKYDDALYENAKNKFHKYLSDNPKIGEEALVFMRKNKSRMRYLRFYHFLIEQIEKVKTYFEKFIAKGS